MSKKNNLKATPEVKPLTNVFKLKPLTIEQPIEIIQAVKLTAPEQPAEPAPAPAAAPKKAKCKVRKAQKAWLVITLLLAIAAVAAFLLNTPVTALVNRLIESNTTNDYAAWTLTNHALTAGIILFAAFVASVLVRFILHPFACKVKKGKPCYLRREANKFWWAMLVFGLALFAADALALHILGTEKALAAILALQPSIALYVAIAVVVYFLLLTIRSIRLKRKLKRLAAK